jgi:hypothetical protein
MSAFEQLAKQLVAEVPITKLQVMLKRDSRVQADDGGFCGNGCPGTSGFVCGLRCPLTRDAVVVGVIDAEGRLGLTAGDLKEIRDDLPKLRRSVFQQIEANLSLLR